MSTEKNILRTLPWKIEVEIKNQNIKWKIKIENQCLFLLDQYYSHIKKYYYYFFITVSAANGENKTF